MLGQRCLFDDNDEFCNRIDEDIVLIPENGAGGGNNGGGNNGGGGSDGFQCQTAGFFADNEICSKYYECIGVTTYEEGSGEVEGSGGGEGGYDDLVLRVHYCPEGQYVSAVRANGVTCTNRLLARPVSKTCDRCEASNLQFVTIMNTSCIEFVFCQNNKRVENSENKCPADQGAYFNEGAQACHIGNMENYPNRHLCESY